MSHPIPEPVEGQRAGTGEALNEYSSTGQWPGYNVRQEQMAEAIQLIRALWSGEKITHDGAHSGAPGTTRRPPR